MFKNRYLFPLKIGIIFGIISGLLHCKEDLLAHDYLHYRLFKTVTGLLASAINHQVAVISLVLYAVFLVYVFARSLMKSERINRAVSRVGQVIAGNTLSRKTRTAYRALMIFGLFIGIWFKLGLVQWLKQFDSLLFQTAFAQSKWQILIAGIVLVLGAILLITYRPKSTEPIHAETPVVAIGDLLAGVRRVMLLIERQNGLYSAAALVFLMLNVSTAFFWANASLSLPEKPNVIIIMADTLRADHVGCYGYSRNTTPNIDRLAKDGIRFNQAIANSSWTTASVASFMTSQYPQSVLLRGEDGNGYGGSPTLTTHVATLAQSLRDQGYATGAVVSNTQFGKERNAGQGFDYFNDCSELRGSTSPTVISSARNWIGKNKDKRFFFFALLMDIHSPYRRHPEFDFDPKYSGKCRDEVSVTRNDTLATAKCSVSHMQDLYDSNVAYTDHYIGLLIDDLKKKGLYDKSIIVFLSDHGEQFADHGGFFHGNTLYRELLHVPLIIKLPHQMQGRVIDGPFPLINLSPTLIKQIGEDAASIRPKGKAVDLKNVKVMRDASTFSATSLYTTLRSVQTEEFKYILDVKSRKGQLFDLKKDPGEKRNIVNAQPSMSAYLNKLLLDNEKELSTAAVQNVATPTKPPSAKEREKMRSLGYLQ
ncbi:MAG TPA: sulfatase [Armatimonadota bacterium]|jgi:arylsulfatase A-like enzyme